MEEAWGIDQLEKVFNHKFDLFTTKRIFLFYFFQSFSAFKTADLMARLAMDDACISLTGWQLMLINVPYIWRNWGHMIVIC